MSPKELVNQFLPAAKIMQLATSANDEPWVCTVHFYSDDALNLYWISKPDRWHSWQISQNPQVAATILVHENTPDENYVVAVTVAGQAELVEPIDENVGQAFIKKLNREATLLEDIASGRNPHKFYRLKPERLVLFDTKNFPADPRQEFKL